MTLRTRRIIYFLFILLFFILAPLIIFYTTGYRYDFKRGKILKTGGIFLYVKTPKPQIFLNDVPQKKISIFTNEMRINNLLPNKYNLKIIKDNYFPWEKNLNVQSKQTTFVEHVILFKKSHPLLSVSGNIKILNFSPNKQFLSYLINNRGVSEIWISDLETQNKSLIYRATGNLEFNNENIIKWSPDGQKIILILRQNQKRQYFIFNTKKLSEPINLKELTNISFKKLIWSPRNDNIIYGLDAKAIYRLNVSEGSSTKVANITDTNKINFYLNDFIIKNNAFYYLKNNSHDSLLVKKNIDGGKTKIILRLDPLPYQLSDSGPENTLSLINKQNNEFILLELSKPSVLLSGKAKELLWSNNKERLLYYNNFEIWFYDLKEKKTELITRYSKEIKKARWVPGFDYIAFIMNNDLNIIELDGRDKRNFYEYTSGQNVNQFVIDKNGKNIYLSGTINNNPGLYILNIQ